MSVTTAYMPGPAFRVRLVERQDRYDWAGPWQLLYGVWLRPYVDQDGCPQVLVGPDTTRRRHVSGLASLADRVTRW